MLTCQSCSRHEPLRCRLRRPASGQGRETLCPSCAVALRHATPDKAPVHLVRELWDASAPDYRCPHVSYNGEKCPSTAR